MLSRLLSKVQFGNVSPVMTKVLVSDPIDQAGIDILSQVAEVDQRIGLTINDLK